MPYTVDSGIYCEMAKYLEKRLLEIYNFKDIVREENIVIFPNKYISQDIIDKYLIKVID